MSAPDWQDPGAAPTVDAYQLLVRGPLDALAEAMADCCAKVLVMVDPDDPETEKAAKKALKAIHVVGGHASRPAAAATGDTPEPPTADPTTPIRAIG